MELEFWGMMVPEKEPEAVKHSDITQKIIDIFNTEPITGNPNVINNWKIHGAFDFKISENSIDESLEIKYDVKMSGNSKYSGQVSPEGKREGFGRTYDENFIFEGQWHNDLLHGKVRKITEFAVKDGIWQHAVYQGAQY